jgi:hypothetical protein
MGLQTGLRGPGIPVRERGRHQAGDPVTLTCRTPYHPCLVNSTWRSMKLSASRTAA